MLYANPTGPPAYHAARMATFVLLKDLFEVLTNPLAGLKDVVKP